MAQSSSGPERNLNLAVHSLSGMELLVAVPTGLNVRRVKGVFKQVLGVQCAAQQLCRDGEVLPDDFELGSVYVELPTWFALGDVADSQATICCSLDLDLVFVSHPCTCCGQIRICGMKRCSSCGVWYCSHACQRVNWPAHKFVCNP